MLCLQFNSKSRGAITAFFYLVREAARKASALKNPSASATTPRRRQTAFFSGESTTGPPPLPPLATPAGRLRKAKTTSAAPAVHMTSAAADCGSSSRGRWKIRCLLRHRRRQVHRRGKRKRRGAEEEAAVEGEGEEGVAAAAWSGRGG
jgi:hypothetical protein